MSCTEVTELNKVILLRRVYTDIDMWLQYLDDYFISLYNIIYVV